MEYSIGLAFILSYDIYFLTAARFMEEGNVASICAHNVLIGLLFGPSGLPSVPSMPGEVRLHWTTRNPGNRCREPAEASEGGSFCTVPFRRPKPHCSQLGKGLVCADSHDNEERTVQAV